MMDPGKAPALLGDCSWQMWHQVLLRQLYLAQNASGFSPHHSIALKSNDWPCTKSNAAAHVACYHHALGYHANGLHPDAKATISPLELDGAVVWGTR
eukprot:1155102-Pelagomonas_calceolata.AAC.11